MDLLRAWQCPWNSKTFTAAAEEGMCVCVNRVILLIICMY
jgi:hypothetical protein